MTSSPPARAGKTRPGTVTFAVLLQWLLALFLAVTSVVGFIYGSDAQEAFEDELAAQGVDVADMPAGSANFGGDVQSVIPMAIAIIILIVLALGNGAGNRVTRILTWIFQPLVLLCGGVLFAGQLAAAPLMQWGFDNSGDEQLENLDAEALIDAAYGAYPGWSLAVDWIVLALATLGSLLVIILLAVPSANAYFRKEEPEQYIPGAPPA